MKEKLEQKLREIVKKLTSEDVVLTLSIPKDISNGDFTSNVAFQLSKILNKNPLDTAQLLVKEFGNYAVIEKIEAVQPGFINFYLSTESLSKSLQEVLKSPEKVATTKRLQNRKIMVEFAHPNTHKELHIGHMRTLTTGESLARILEANGAEVFRANYQGDIGPHVAKAMYGVEKMLKEQHLSLDEIEKWPYSQKAHFLGQGYARGSKDYETDAKEEIDALNVALYKRDPQYQELYQLTRKWSLDYYDEFYQRFYTKFDKLFFEGDLDREAVKVVEANVGKVFTKDPDGSVIFKGEPYGLHTRVFLTKKGTPTYEGKEIALGFAEYAAFPFDMKIHVVASEQAGYFQVVFKALELIDPKIFEGHEYHLSMGMVQLVGRKMSSRTGDVLTVDELLDEVKEAASSQFKEGKLSQEEKQKVLEQVTIGAVKYSILRGSVAKNALFDIKESVSLDGNSGPYVQYAYTRTQSILRKAQSESMKPQLSQDYPVLEDEKKLMQKIVQFAPTVEDAAEKYAPNMVCEYLFELSQMFNNFYQKYRILRDPSKELSAKSKEKSTLSTTRYALSNDEQSFRLALTQGVGIILKQGLNLLGIQAPEKM